MDRYLQYLIQEEIYLIEEDQVQTGPVPVRPEEKEDHTERLINKTVLMISSDDPEMFPPEIRDLLTNILRAINLTLEEVILIHLSPQDSNENPLANYQIENCKVIGFMDHLPEGLHDVFITQKYTLYDTGHFTSMLTDPLKEIFEDRSKKVVLWDKLKELYQLR